MNEKTHTMNETDTPNPTGSQALVPAEGGGLIQPGKSRKFRIQGDVVFKATADLPDEQRALIRWLHAYAAEHDLHPKEVAKLIRYDETTVWRVLTGKYEGSLDNVCRQIAEAKHLIEERAQSAKVPYIQTALARRIETAVTAALEYQRIVFIIGESQTGKTTVLRHYQKEHNHGTTTYVRMPTGGALCNFLEVLADALKISPQNPEKVLRRRIIAMFDDRMLLVVDECHQCLLGGGTGVRSIKTLEFIRELHEISGCGVVLCGTKIFDEEIERGRLAGVLLQCKRRRLATLRLPDRPTAKDLDTFAAAYGLAPAAGEALRIQTDVIQDEALGMWLTLLRMGAKVAAKRKQKLTWQHVVDAHAGWKALERV
jgi:DNA transposition AAA+ family ATPase